MSPSKASWELRGIHSASERSSTDFSLASRFETAADGGLGTDGKSIIPGTVGVGEGRSHRQGTVTHPEESLADFPLASIVLRIAHPCI